MYCTRKIKILQQESFSRGRKYRKPNNVRIIISTFLTAEVKETTN